MFLWLCGCGAVPASSGGRPVVSPRLRDVVVGAREVRVNSADFYNNKWGAASLVSTQEPSRRDSLLGSPPLSGGPIAPPDPDLPPAGGRPWLNLFAPRQLVPDI